MSEVARTHYEKLAEVAIKRFAKRNVTARYVPDRGAAVAALLDMIPADAVVGSGESVTLLQLGIFDALRQRGQRKVVYPFERNEDGLLKEGLEGSDRMMREVLMADVFLSGTNAVTLDGKIVNIDGLGNRVAPMIFGPRRVIIVVGVNKLVKDEAEARSRIHMLCTPMNALRHGVEHHDAHFLELPCVKTGVCIDCSMPQRMCNFISIITGASQWDAERMHVVIVGETLGF